MSIIREPVQSSMISSIGWGEEDKSDETLQVEFSGGKIANYYDVPESVFQDIMNSASIGQTFISLVRNGGFDWEYV